MIYWFTGASTQAVTTGAYRAVEFIKRNIKLDSGATKASITDSKKVVEICTQYAQKGMFNIFLVVFFSTLAFAFLEPFFFIGYLISIALFGLFQAIFMANAGGAWDNAKKLVEVDLKEKGTELHAATVVGDTVGDPFKDTSSVAMNPIIKFTTLFGLLAVEIAVGMSRTKSLVLSGCFLAASLVFVWRSFYAMRITTAKDEAPSPPRRQARERLGPVAPRLRPPASPRPRPGPRAATALAHGTRAPPAPRHLARQAPTPLPSARERGFVPARPRGAIARARAVGRAAAFEPARNRCSVRGSRIGGTQADARLEDRRSPIAGRRLFRAPRTRGMKQRRRGSKRPRWRSTGAVHGAVGRAGGPASRRCASTRARRSELGGAAQEADDRAANGSTAAASRTAANGALARNGDGATASISVVAARQERGRHRREGRGDGRGACQRQHAPAPHA